MGECTPDSGYDKCYEYSYGKAYVKVQVAVPPLVWDTEMNKWALRGKLKYKITGSGTVQGWMMRQIEPYDQPSCDASGCNGKRILISLDTNTGTCLELGNEDLVECNKGIFCEDLPYGFMIVGHSYNQGYYVWVAIPYDGSYFIDNYIICESVIIPDEVYTNEEFTLKATFRNRVSIDGTNTFYIYVNGNKIDEVTVSVDANAIETKSLGKYFFTEPGEYRFEIKDCWGRTKESTVVVTEPPPPPSPDIQLIDTWFECVEYQLEGKYYGCSDKWYGGEVVGPYDWLHTRFYGRFKNNGGAGSKSYTLTATGCTFGQGITEKEVTVILDANEEKDIELTHVFKDGPGKMTVCIE